jgi:hypothetical protein
MKKIIALAILVSASMLAGCGTQLKVAEIDQATGKIKSDIGTVTNATIVTSKQTSFAKFGGIAYFSNGGDFGVSQLKATKLFNEVLDFDSLQKLVVANNLQDKVPSVAEPIGLSKLAKAYKPFLWINAKRVVRDRKQYMQLIATNPENLEELFVAEVYLDFMWAGVTDQNSRYPLFNALIDWARKNP